MSKNFALIGAGGFVAPRHMAAIRDTGNRLCAAVDPNDSVGIIDSYFPDAQFFTTFEHFDGYVEGLRGAASSDVIQYMAICSPNDLHADHMRYGLRRGCDVICEKPAVLNPEDIDSLIALEAETEGTVSTILQLRLHPAIIALKEKVARETDKKRDVNLTYITSRGNWYHQSWKGDDRRSGGIATNIGVHFFDMLHYIFGELQECVLHYTSATTAAGYLEYDNARVNWFLSIDIQFVPAPLRANGQRTYRSITVDDKEIEFSGGFTDLHTQSYQRVLEGSGFGLKENRTAIETVYNIRHATPTPSRSSCHPFLAECGL